MIAIAPDPYRKLPPLGAAERARLVERCAAANAEAQQLVEATITLLDELADRRGQLRSGAVECRLLIDRLVTGRLKISPDRPVRPRSAKRAGALDYTDRLVLEHTGLARALARRYQGRGEPFDDLLQVAMLGLVKAARRFD